MTEVTIAVYKENLGNVKRSETKIRYLFPKNSEPRRLKGLRKAADKGPTSSAELQDKRKLSRNIDSKSYNLKSCYLDVVTDHNLHLQLHLPPRMS